MLTTETQPEDAEALSGFLRRILGLRDSSPIVNPANMHWKYWAPRADWQGSRSFIVRRGAAIVAHAAAWPVRVRAGDRVLCGAHAIDWASDPECPGAGIWLLRRIRARVQLLIATGGRAITQEILPALGFRTCGEVCTFARPLRPLAQAITTRDRTWRVAARLLRNTGWQLSEPLSIPAGWSASPIDPGDLPDRLWPHSSDDVAVAARDVDVYRYYSGTSSASHTLWALTRHGEMRGFFCLASASRVARVADLWLPSTSADDWSDAFRTAAAVAVRRSGACEISAWTSTACGREALARAGFRLRDRAPLGVLGAPDLLGGRELHVQMLDCDASFLAGDGASYLT